MATAVQRGTGGAAAAPEQPAQLPAAARTRRRWVMPAVIAAAVIGGAALARLAVVPRMSATAKAAAGSPAKPVAATSLYRLENLVVNPAESQGTRFLMASVVVEADQAVTTALDAHDVELRDRVTALLSSQSLDLLVSTAARDSVKHLVAVALTPFLPPGTRVRVYLPQFVIQ